MPDANVTAAVSHWLPRFLQNGVDFNDFGRTTAGVEAWEDWLPAWNRAADDHARFAEENESRGNARSAGEAWLRASSARHFGKFVWSVDMDMVADATRRSADEMRRAHSFLDPTAEHLQVAIPDGTAHVNLRLPRGLVGPAAWVLIIPGLDSTKEELFYLEEAFLVRGMATATMDGPGQGETRLSGAYIRPDYEAASIPVIDALIAHDALSDSAIGVVGVSLGGYYAPRVAAFDPRVKAMISGSGPYSMAEIWDGTPEVTRLAFTVNAGLTDTADGYRVAQTLTLDGVLGKMTAPALYVTGSNDRLVPFEHSERQARETPNSEVVVYDGGSHVVANIPYRARPMMADWMHSHLLAASTQRGD
jgi:2,6-dihydroxypseudooxynicotine hydrolase